MSSKKVLFVHPPSPMLERQRLAPPLGQLQLAAILRKGGHRAEILDIGESQVDTEELLNTQYLLFSATTPQYPEALRIVKPVMELKRKRGLKNPIAAIGGAHASYMGAKLLMDGWNYVCVGEGEKIIVPLVEGKINEGLIVGKQIQNLDELPYPTYDLLDPNIYRRSDKHRATYPVMTSRGCPFDCAFCSKFVGRSVRYHSPGYVIGLVNEIKKNGVKQVVKYDDTFTLKPDRVVDICKGLEPLGITWRCNAHANTLITGRAKETGMLSKMRDAGCVVISIGVDGPDQDSLNYLNKGTTVKKCEEAIDEVKKAGILAKVFLIYIPGKGVRHVEIMKGFIKRTDPDIIQLSVLLPMPGSRMYEQLESYGLRLDKTKLEDLCYQGREGEFPDVGLLKEEDYQVLEDLNIFLRRWKEVKPEMPI